MKSAKVKSPKMRSAKMTKTMKSKAGRPASSPGNPVRKMVGLEMSVSRTVAVRAASAFEAFSEPAHLSKWFTTNALADLRVGGRYSNGDKDEGEFLSIQPPRRLRFTWENRKHCPGTVVQADFTPRGVSGTVVRVTHSRLRTKRDVEGMRKGWSWALASLKSYLETGAPISEEEWKKAKGEL